ncbi:TIM54 [[Candida] subhashii]|uniref:Mitochondrial import inner membrane translocase subunit TIM54 n=1 Tax=[Candida] subhashii TaxID=561895 RepID=A0A8J5UJJ9_9ASCO|nr:TIM54 [[Candida] subhashii]KAG7661201.1 TIM54 [[Candida] subhashii]
MSETGEGGPKTAPTTTGSTSTAKPTPPVKKGYSNPALRMMGIPRISLPSRNWMIFWTVLASIGGGIAYDKYQQKQIRKKWMNSVSELSEVTYTTNQLPRKLTIYIAPPPNDFLEESLIVFRKFIKPILNASAIDFEIFSESRQGDIRASVAQKIRDLRRAELEKSKGKQVQQQESEPIQEAASSSSWKSAVPNFVTKSIPSYGKSEQTEEQQQSQGDLQPEEVKPRSDLYKAKDVMGLYKIFPSEIEITPEDSQDEVAGGGIICIGRGAYKEFITGIHEGLLGPLDKPPKVIEAEEAIAAEKQKEREEKEKEGKSIEDDDEDEEGNKNLNPVPLKYINTADYETEGQLAPELDLSGVLKDKNGVPLFFEQPVYVFPVYNLMGFSNIPRKIYRYFTRRYLADDYGERTMGIVLKKTRPFEYKDILMAKEEEFDWPKKWVAKGKERNSEWIQELQGDERVTTRMKVFDPSIDKK